MTYSLCVGTDLEVQYSLLTFGIDCGELPVNPDGSLKREWLKDQIQHQVEQDKERMRKETEESKGYVLFPTNKDVLMGRGRPFQSFTGNLQFARITDKHRDRYQNASEHLDKACIAANIATMVQESGSRFLKRRDGVGWEIASESVVREKVCQSLRSKPKVDKAFEIGSVPSLLMPKRARYVASDE